MVKKLLGTVFSFVLVSKLAFAAYAQGNTVNLYLFWSKSCSHCKKEIVFIESIKPDYPNLVVHDFEVGSSENAGLLKDVGKALSINTHGIPVTIIGEDYIVGFHGVEVTGEQIIELIEETSLEGDPDSVGKIIAQIESERKLTSKFVSMPSKINVPFLGQVEIKSLSLPALTLIIGLLDGFNPCAMWVLLFLISLLLPMKDRRKMWILGISFIATSAFVYFMFLAAWLNLFLFLGFVLWVRVAVGIFALVAGVYQIKYFIENKAGECKTTGRSTRKFVFDKIDKITHAEKFVIAFFGIILLAFAVNLIELVCSAGLPAIYTQVLSLTNLRRWQYYFYLLFYTLIFMIDDLIVFVIAMTTLKAVGIQGKYARLSYLVGGTIIFIIGVLMLFKPELLMFG